MKRLMILGAAKAQIPLYEAAKRIGCLTIAASIPGPYPCFEIADKTCFVDVRDEDAVVEKAKTMEIDGIASCALDFALGALGKTNDALGLCGPSAKACALATDKYHMKLAFEKEGVSVARYVVLHSPHETSKAMETLSFPMVSKAVDQCGSLGIYKCNNEKELQDYVEKSFSVTRKPYVLVEEFLKGHTFGVEALVQNGNIVFMMMDNTINVQAGVETPIGHSIPMDEEGFLKDETRRQVDLCVKALGLDNCALNFDFMRTQDGIYVLEATGRAGANGLSELVSWRYGIDYYEVIVRLALGEDVTRFFTRQREGACVYTKIYTMKTGVLKRIHVPQGDLSLCLINAMEGEKVNGYHDGRDGLGHMMAQGKTLAEAREKIRRTEEKMEIEVES